MVSPNGVVPTICGGTFVTSIKIHSKLNLDIDTYSLANFMLAS